MGYSDEEKREWMIEEFPSPCGEDLLNLLSYHIDDWEPPAHAGNLAMFSMGEEFVDPKERMLQRYEEDFAQLPENHPHKVMMTFLKKQEKEANEYLESLSPDQYGLLPEQQRRKQLEQELAEAEVSYEQFQKYEEVLVDLTLEDYYDQGYTDEQIVEEVFGGQENLDQICAEDSEAKTESFDFEGLDDEQYDAVLELLQDDFEDDFEDDCEDDFVEEVSDESVNALEVETTEDQDVSSTNYVSEDEESEIERNECKSLASFKTSARFMQIPVSANLRFSFDLFLPSGIPRPQYPAASVVDTNENTRYNGCNRELEIEHKSECKPKHKSKEKNHGFGNKSSPKIDRLRPRKSKNRRYKRILEECRQS